MSFRQKHEAAWESYRAAKLELAKRLFPVGTNFTESDLWRKVAVGDTRRWILRWITEGHAVQVSSGRTKPRVYCFEAASSHGRAA